MRKTPTDRCANYNAFGYDPNGRVAYLATFYFGPDWVPSYTVQQFAGPPEPPRYGPPAVYQLACLPKGWKPTPPPRFGGDPPECGGPPWVDPPRDFHPRIFAAFQHLRAWQGYTEDDESDASTEIDDDGEGGKEGQNGGISDQGGDELRKEDEGEKETKGEELMKEHEGKEMKLEDDAF